MGLLSSMLRQTVVYWAPDGADKYGRPALADPVELRCRWEDVSEEFLDQQGTKRLSRAKVFLPQDVVVGGLLLLGDLDETEESSFPGNPKDYEGVYEIRRFQSTPSLRGERTLRMAML